LNDDEDFEPIWSFEELKSKVPVLLAKYYACPIAMHKNLDNVRWTRSLYGIMVRNLHDFISDVERAAALRPVLSELYDPDAWKLSDDDE
jgi:hypothetical protein